MSGRYTTGGKRKSSMVHADRTWTCPCGKVCRGNGGKSSHQRACLMWRRRKVDALRRSADRLESTASFPGEMQHTIRHNREEADRIEAELRDAGQWTDESPA